MSKPVESFSQLTIDLRKRLDEEGIPWHDNSEIIGEHYVSIFERTRIGDIKDLAHPFLSIYYGWNVNENGKVFPNSYGYPDKLECWIPNNIGQNPTPMSIDEIIETYKSGIFFKEY